MSDPDSGIWFLNALIYGAVGYTFWLFFMGDDPTTASKKDGQGDPSTLKPQRWHRVRWVVMSVNA